MITTRPHQTNEANSLQTLEDQMLHRRKHMTAQEHQKAEHSLLDDGPMSTLIKNARALPTSSQEDQCQAAKMQNQLPIFDRKNVSDVEFEDPYADMIFPIETKKTKRLEKRGRSGPPDVALPDGEATTSPQKRSLDSHDTPRASAEIGAALMAPTTEHTTAELGTSAPPKKKKKRVGFVDDAAGEGSSTLQSESPATASHLPTRSIPFEDDPTDTPMPTSIFGTTE